MKNKFKTMINTLDGLVPDPWVVDGIKQSRLSTQLAFLLGFIVGSILALIFIY